MRLDKFLSNMGVEQQDEITVDGKIIESILIMFILC